MSSAHDQFEKDCRARGIDVSTALAIREAVAKVIEGHPSALTFQTPTRDIQQKASRVRLDGWDDMAFIFAFEEVTGLQLSDDLRLPRITTGRFFSGKFQARQHSVNGARTCALS